MSVLMIPLALHFASVAALPAYSLEPSIVTKVAISTGMPFEMPTATSAPALAVRQWDWAPSAPASAPAWTPAPQPSWAPAPVETMLVTPTPTWLPSPTPSYSWEETHNDDKNTLTHEIIAAIVVGSFVGIPILGVIFFCIYRKCRGNKVKNQGRPGDIEAARLADLPRSDGSSDYTWLDGPAGQQRKSGVRG